MKLNTTKSTAANRKSRFVFLVPVIGFALVLLCGCAPAAKLVQHEEDRGRIAVRFVYGDDQAGTVCVSGSFNNWSEHSDCMSRASGTWSVTLALPPGRYQYLFLVDGRIRREDPRNVLSEDNGFGMKNSVLVVE
jgi:hypothetical protein